MLDQGPLFAAGGSTLARPGARLPDQRLEDDGRVRPLHGREVQLARARRAVVLPAGRRPRGRAHPGTARSTCGGATGWRSRGASRAALLDPDECLAAWPLLDREARARRLSTSRPTASPRPSGRARPRPGARPRRGARFLGEHDGDRHPHRRRSRRGRRHRPRRVPGRHRGLRAPGIWGPRVGALVGVAGPAPAARPPVRRRPRRCPSWPRSRPRPTLEDLRPILRHPGPRPLLPRARRPPRHRRLRPPADADRPGDAARRRPTRRSMPSVLDVHARRLRPSRGRWAQELHPGAPRRDAARRASTASSRSRPTACR